MKITNEKKRAKEKQLEFKKSRKLTKSGTHGYKEYKHILSDEDAKKGANFYCYSDADEWTDLKHWAKQNTHKVDFTSNGLKNMLRSEHIAYNIFYPLEKLRASDPKKLNSILEEIIGCKIDEVKDIKVEYAGAEDKRELLNDKTSFDAYIEFTSNGHKYGAGIEIKYTEKSYAYGKTEKENLQNLLSPYWLTARASGIYDLSFENIELLKTKKLKQTFRNHLLGLKMIQEGMLDHFYSIHLFPKQNTYQHYAVGKPYLKTITDEFKKHFILLTFEELADVLEEHINDNWVQYFRDRYCT